MKKDKVMTISMVSIISFICLFLVTLVFYHDIIVIPNSFFKETSKEYWFWHLSNTPVKNEYIIVSISRILLILFKIIFVLEYMYILSNEKYKKLINKKEVLIDLIIGLTIYLIGFFIIKYIITHYRLYMTFFSTGILALMVLRLIFKLRRT